MDSVTHAAYVLYLVRYEYVRGERSVGKYMHSVYPDMGSAIQARDLLVTRNGGAGAMYAIEPVGGHPEPPKRKIVPILPD